MVSLTDNALYIFFHRSQERSIFEVGFFTNKVFCVAVFLSVVGQLMVIYFPPLQYIFQTEPLALSDLLFLVALSSSVFIASEVRKAYFNRNNHKKRNPVIDLSHQPSSFTSLKKKGSQHMV